MKGKFFPLSIEAANILKELHEGELHAIMHAMYEYDSGDFDNFDNFVPDFSEVDDKYNEIRVCEMCWLLMKKIAQEKR